MREEVKKTERGYGNGNGWKAGRLSAAKTKFFFGG